MVSRKRSRTGDACMTCKSRHVRCDGRKPSCSQCVLTRRRCEGYPVDEKPSSTIDLIQNDTERRALLFFRTRTIYRIFGHHDADDWVSTLLQYAYSQQPIKHAIVAISSLHESLEPTTTPVLFATAPNRNINPAFNLALRHYNHVITYLQDACSTNSSQPDTIMLLLILLVCLEQLRSGDAACFIHLMAGLRQVYWWRNNTHNYNTFRAFSKSTSELINGKITLILQRLRVQFALCMDQRHLSGIVGTTPCIPEPVIPPSYTSLAIARADFDKLMNYVFSNIDRLQEWDEMKSYQNSFSLLYQWKHALDCSNSLRKSDPESCTRNLLELFFHTAIIIVSTYNASAETIFDAWTEHFETIVNLAEKIVQVWTPNEQKYRMLFSFDLGLAPPLFLTATRCRHPKIRRKAVYLLQNSLYYHGAWHDRYSGVCAQRVIEIEEDGLQDLVDAWQVPEFKRIRKLSADLDEDEGVIKMQYICSPFADYCLPLTTVVPLNRFKSQS